ncbi:hypothetical protein RHSIM_Rhsim07G0155000 [Rhododendron simsii]|uniref:Uncharacterized protein n=1 Tax=Rhododendron simsii TaxID=118357 RepID=A0A834GR78_RHOSS|nr:hypothetical protein RHSIM_Rhsim07G0155000 [Rhododendron simsii]
MADIDQPETENARLDRLEWLIMEQLKQKGLTTVSIYEAEFANLAEYTRHMVATENRKARKFEDGLKPEIRKVVRPMRLPTYAEVDDRALLVE